MTERVWVTGLALQTAFDLGMQLEVGDEVQLCEDPTRLYWVEQKRLADAGGTVITEPPRGMSTMWVRCHRSTQDPIKNTLCVNTNHVIGWRRPAKKEAA